MSAAATETEPTDAALLVGRPSDAELTTQVLGPVLAPWPRAAWALLAFSAMGVVVLIISIVWTVTQGIGVWGNNIPVAWAFGITNFVWWIGIGHAGTFISAFLFLLEQRWRASVNRLAEAMTIFAVMQAGMFPLLHLGRPWFFYWLLPYPATMQVWPQFRSALPWDAAAVSTYFTVSFLFWYVGLVPDLASARERAGGIFRRRVYGVLAAGWRGSARDWRTYRTAYALLAGLATPLVISVHSIVSLDFAITQLPGWHSTIFPPYFVAGALYSGFAMVLTLVIPVRWALGLENIITGRHLDLLAKMVLTTGWIVIYSYGVEFFMAWYSGEAIERYTHFVALPFGHYSFVFWIMLMACNCITPQFFWSGRLRRNLVVLFVASILINVGMWSERFMIIVGSLSRDSLPSSWHDYAPTWVDLGLLSGTMSFFVFLFLMFLRFVPCVALSEVKEIKTELVKEEATP
jgi:molybdopterin-containing oxidoreductase family membrane subunit